MAELLTVKPGSEGALHTPATAVEPHLYGLPVDAEFSRPIANGHALAVTFDPSSLSAVSDLLRWGRPAHVAWLIRAVIVNTVKLKIAMWRWPNILEKGFKRFTPTFTNSDAAPAIPRISVYLGVVTARNHVGPSTIFFGLHSFASLAMTVIHGGRIAWSKSFE